MNPLERVWHAWHAPWNTPGWPPACPICPRFWNKSVRSDPPNTRWGPGSRLLTNSLKPSGAQFCHELGADASGGRVWTTIRRTISMHMFLESLVPRLFEAIAASQIEKSRLGRAFEATARWKSMLEQAFESAVRSKSPLGRVFAAAVRSHRLLAITVRRCRLISTELCSI